MIRKLILIRHGMTAGNREKRYSGMTDEKDVYKRQGLRHGRQSYIIRSNAVKYPAADAACLEARVFSPRMPDRSFVCQASGGNKRK